MFGKFALHVSLGLNLIGIAMDTADSTFAGIDVYRLKKDQVCDTDKPSRKLRQFICKFQNLEFEEIESRFLRYNAGISVINKGRFQAKFKVTYLLEDSTITAVNTDNFKRKQAVLKEFNIPKKATHVMLTIKILQFGLGCGFGCNLWKTMLEEEIKHPYFKVFNLSGTFCFPRINEIKSQQNKK